MKNIRYILVFIIMMILPLMVNAASMSLDGEVGDTIAEYIIKYTPDEDPIESIKLKISTTNDDLEYTLKLSGEYGTCSNLECTLITTQITTDTEIGRLTVKNPTSEKKETTITLNATPQKGKIDSVSKTFSLKAIQTTTTKPPSSDANMTGISFSVGILDKNFDSNVTEYTVTGIKDTIPSITLTPTCDNCDYTITCPSGGCTVKDGKRVTLETGANNVVVNIKSEDGNNNKSYNFNIYRGDIITSSPYLKDIKIKDAKLSPKFDSLTNDYSVNVKGNIEKLDITTTPEDPTADIQIKGNENLKEGENTITITVTSSDGENKQVYTILVNKEKEEKTTKKVATTKVKKKKDNKWLIIGLSILILTIIIVSFVIIFKKKKNKDNNKNDNNKGNKTKDKEQIEKIEEEKDIIKENTDALNILEETRKEIDDEEKTDIDEALDDLMQTKKLELGDLDLYN